MEVSCRNTIQSVGNIITQSNFLTLKYIADGWGTDSNGFTLVLTAIKNLSNLFAFPPTKQRVSDGISGKNYWKLEFLLLDHACKDFRCKTNEFCISTDLLCDNINHCGDGSDESSYAQCQSLYPDLYNPIFFPPILL